MSMIKVKIEKNRLNEPIFKLGFKKLNDKEERFLKRALIEGKEISGTYKYEIPLKYFVPIMNNIDKENIKLDKKHNVIMKIKLLAVNVGLIAVSVYVKRNYILYIEITYIFHIMEFVIACIIKFSRGKNTKN